MRLIDADELKKDFEDITEYDGVGVKYIINSQSTKNDDNLNMYKWIVKDMASELSKTQKYNHMTQEEIIQDWINEWVLD